MLVVTHPQIYLGLLFILLFFCETTLAQYTAVPFLLVPPTARLSAMGGSGVGLADDVSASFINPAGLGFQKGQEVNLTYTGWLTLFQDIQYRHPSPSTYKNIIYGSGNYRIEIPQLRGGFAFSVTYFNLNSYKVFSPGPYDPPLSIFEYAFSASYGIILTPELSIGAGIRYTHSAFIPEEMINDALKLTASSLSGDIGILFRPSRLIIPFTQIDVGERFGIGFAITNMGKSISYNDYAGDPLPTNMRIGIALDFLKNADHRITWTCDANKLIISGSYFNADPFYKAIIKTWTTFYDGRKKNFSDIMQEIKIGTGIEYWYSNLIALRVGWFYEDPRMGNRQMYTFGAGARYNVFGLDINYIALYGPYTNKSPVNKTLRLTLVVNWDGGY